MEDNQASSANPEKLIGISSLLGIGDVGCDKCGEAIKHLDRYCCSTRECPVCGATFDTIAERDGHFSQHHPSEPSRGTRYCADCSCKAGYLKMVRNKKTGKVLPVMFVLRDEEVITEDFDS